MSARDAVAIALGTAAIACVAAPFGVVGQRNAPKPPPPAPVTHTAPALQAVAAEPAPAQQAPEPVPVHHTFRVGDLSTDSRVSIATGTVGKHTFIAALVASGLLPKEAHRVLAGFSGLKNLDHCDPHDTFTYAKAQDNHVVAFELVPSGAMERESFDFFQEREEVPQGKLAAARVSIPIERKRVGAGFVVGDDLHASLASANLNEQVSSLLDDALDGHAELSELRGGARLRLIATELRLEGSFVSYAPIDALEYTPAPVAGAQKPAIRVYWFAKGSTESKHGGAVHGGYYDADGRQPYHGGWRSPVPMARISSRFNPNRMHPVLHVLMPHNGVDFAAPPGTPVYAAASGVVRSVGDGGPCGNMVQIDHPNGLTSAYCHLSRFGPISPGEHVETRQLIGYVGQTGRATGPHLHFAVKRGEVFLDPLRMRLDGVRVVPQKLRAEFDADRLALDALLDPIILPDAPVASGKPDHEDETE